MGDFILLLVVCFGLVGFELFLCADVGVIVTAIVDEFTIDGEVHDLIADIIQKVLRVGCQDETMWVFGEICL
jgi:hypothetical protein